MHLTKEEMIKLRSCPYLSGSPQDINDLCKKAHAEINRLRDCLRDIGLGRQPMDYGRWEVACERQARDARACLEYEP